MFIYLLHAAIGNPRGNENPMLLSFAIIFFRLHNQIAERLNNEDYGDDEQIFNEARRRVIAYHQVGFKGMCLIVNKKDEIYGI